LNFSAIKDAIEEYWNLKGDQSSARGKGAREHRRHTIDMAVHVSDLLFGNRPTGPEEVGKVSSSLKQLLKKREFSLPEFVGEASDADPNIEDFFNLSSQDMVMMTRIAEWGKVSSTDVANSLTETREKQSTQEETEANPSLMMAHCLSELTLAVRDGFSFSDILMIAQEGVFRCIPCECVIVMFLDQKKKFMKGKLCVGRKTSVDASRCQVTLNSAQGLAAKNLKGRDAEVFACDPKTNILDHDSLLHELQIQEVLLVPIRVAENAIGQFLLCRSKADAPFSMDDMLWMNAIASHVGMSFSQL